MEESDFCSISEALSRAHILTFELGIPLFRVNSFNPSFARSFTKRHVGCPSFDESVTVLLGLDDDLAMGAVTISHDELSTWQEKPWALRSHDFDQELCHLEPLSEEAVLIRCAPLYSKCRLLDNWLEPTPADMHRDVPVPDPDVIPDPFHAPVFIRDLLTAADLAGVFTDLDDDAPFRVRTWYIHHQHHRRMTLSRTVELYEDWRTWERDLTSTWRDFIHPNEEIRYQIVTPDPYRGYEHQILHADLILSQGEWLDRKAGLVTLHYHGRQTAPFVYATAASFPGRISGMEVSDMAHATNWCLQGHRCRITHGWQELPFNRNPVHVMHYGHSFQLVINAADIGDSSGTQAPDTLALGSEEQADCADPSQDNRDHAEDCDFDIQADDPDGSDPGSSSDGVHTNDMGVLVYRLGEPDLHGFVPWNSYNEILDHVIRLQHLPRSEIRCFHFVAVSPVGVHDEAEEALILQSIHDISPGSSEKLVLVDVELHFHPLPTGLHVPAATSRRVMRVHDQLHRRQILLLIALDDYCELQASRCMNFKNHNLWQEHDRTVHRIAHGDYIRIQMPPPDDPGLDTEVAIAIARDFGLAQPQVCHSQGSSVSFFQASAEKLQMHLADFQTQLVALHELSADNLLHELRWFDQQPRRASAGRTTTASHGRSAFAIGHESRLNAIVGEANLIECEEEGRIAYITTWYLHHDTFQECRDARPVRLAGPAESWSDEILEVWADLIRPEESVTLSVVYPCPPCTIFECNQAHVIVEQAISPLHISLLVTVWVDDRRGLGVSHVAFSTTPMQNSRSIIRLVELTDECDMRTCSVRWRDFPFAMFDFEEVDNAANIIVKVAPAHAPATDEVAFMQRDTRQNTQGRRHSGGQRGGRSHHGGFCLNADAAPFIPDRPSIDTQPEFAQALFGLWDHAAFAWENEDRSGLVHTFFVDHTDVIPICSPGRLVRLFSDFANWQQRLKQAWSEKVRDGQTLEFLIVSPTPRPMEHEVMACVLLVQSPGVDIVSVVVSVFEGEVRPLPLRARIAVTIWENIYLEHILTSIGYFDAVLGMRPTHQCWAWYGDIPLRWGQPLPGRNGYGIVVQLRRLPPLPPPVAAGDEVVTLQLARLIPPHSQDASSDAISADEQLHTSAVRLLRGHAEVTPLPDYVEVLAPLDECSIEAELRHWGHQCQVVLCQPHDVAVCFPQDGVPSLDRVHFIYVNQDVTDSAGVILHSSESLMQELCHMRFLHQLGYEKAVILKERVCLPGLTVVDFQESVGILHKKQLRSRPLKAWPPARQPVTSITEIFAPTQQQLTNPTCLLRLGVELHDLVELFQSSGTLCTSFEGIEIPEVAQPFLVTLQPAQKYDRIIIYVDGSSQSLQKHCAPLWVDLHGIPDSWAFVAIGETYDVPSDQAFSPWVAGSASEI